MVCTVAPFEDRSNPADRVAALEIVDRYRADRVVIASQHADDESLLDLVRAFKSIGVPVSMLPRPLDLLEAPVGDPEPGRRRAADRGRGAGHPRRRPLLRPRPPQPSRKTKVSVVVPAMNEEKNIGQRPAAQLPEGLHEVILVDGNSSDETIEAARQAYPGDPRPGPERPRQGRRLPHRLRRRHRQPRRHARRRRLRRPGGDPPLRRGTRGRRRLRQGLALPARAAAAPTSPGLRSLGNAVLSGTANVLHGTHFTDLCYGYNAFWARCLPFISLDVPGFEVETLINLRIAGAGMKITEVPSYEADRISGREQPQHLPRRLPRAGHDPARVAAPPGYPAGAAGLGPGPRGAGEHRRRLSQAGKRQECGSTTSPSAPTVGIGGPRPCPARRRSRRRPGGRPGSLAAALTERRSGSGPGSAAAGRLRTRSAPPGSRRARRRVPALRCRTLCRHLAEAVDDHAARRPSSAGAR